MGLFRTKEEKEARRTEKHNQKLLRAQRASELFIGSINSTSKQLLWIMVLNSVLWIWCSYLLAFLGKDQIAESLSSNVCTVILGQIISYFLTKTVENVFKNNNFGGPPQWAVTANSESEQEQNNTGGFTYEPPEIIQPTVTPTKEELPNGYEQCESDDSDGGVDPGCLD